MQMFPDNRLFVFGEILCTSWYYPNGEKQSKVHIHVKYDPIAQSFCYNAAAAAAAY